MELNHRFAVSRIRTRRLITVVAMLGLAGTLFAAMIPSLLSFLDPAGVVSTYDVNGALDGSNPFFQSLGTNGRSCSTCHIADNAFGLSARHAQERFAATGGSDPLFAPVDGANSPNAKRGDAGAHSLLLGNGLIRVALPVPANAEFTIRAVYDPYGCASTIDPVSGKQTISVYRRPLPSTNLGFLSAVMFDGRETVQPLNDARTFQANLVADLMHQAVDATLGHAQAASSPTTEQQTAIVNFELGLYSAQVFDTRAGMLFAGAAQGGPVYLSRQSYYPGANDSLGKDPDGKAFDPRAFTIYDSWASVNSRHDSSGGNPAAARQMIAAGQTIFNTHPLTISNVRGLNDNASLGTSLPIAPFQGTCSTCHDTPNVGNHSFPLPLDIGTGHDPVRETDAQIEDGLSQLSFPDLPVFEITGCPNPFPDARQPNTPFVTFTTDPGKALISGKCSDVNRIKGPILRGLAARAPYFHNGAAQTLEEVVNFYNERFQMNLTDQEKAQLVAFLNSL